MFEHHASHVIMELNHRCLHAARSGDRDEASRVADLAFQIEQEFPEARDELNRLYPKEPTAPGD